MTEEGSGAQSESFRPRHFRRGTFSFLSSTASDAFFLSFTKRQERMGGLNVSRGRVLRRWEKEKTGSLQNGKLQGVCSYLTAAL
ncbi:MAG: hypothetical protein MJ074_08875 [Oscillospiraceae bacterium]|nr:hypothetical protein [Oscillospiraceae bacterium]